MNQETQSVVNSLNLEHFLRNTVKSLFHEWFKVGEFFFWLESSFIRKVIVLIEFCICCLDASIVWIPSRHLFLCRKVELTVRDLALTVPKLCDADDRT